MTETICQVATCQRPSDDWIVCKVCASTFEVLLGEIPWLLDELDTVIAQQTKYTTESSGKAAETPMMFNVKASEMRGQLITALDTAARIVAETNHWKLAYSDAAGASRWLMRSLTAIRLHESGALIVDEITMLSIGSTYVIDRPAAKQYLGDCTMTFGEGSLAESCSGRIYGRAGKDRAACDICGTEWEADTLRAILLKRLDDQLCTAAEIARLSTYLDLIADREQVRKRINQWAKRGQVIEHIDKEGGPSRFQFGEVYVKLAQDDTQRRSA
jgi:hypothetical protein